MPHTVNEWLPIVAAIASVLSALVAWGFATGKFVQRRDQEFKALEARVLIHESRIESGDKARHQFIDRVNAELGRLRHRYELMQQRMDIDEKHSDERQERVSSLCERIEKDIVQLQRQIDQLRGPDDPPDRRRR